MDATIGKRISAYRKKLGLTQDQLAEQLGLTAQAVSKWENDLSCPDITILPKLADIFSVTTDELLGREPEVQPSTVVIAEHPPEEKHTFEFDSDTGNMDFHWDGIKLEGISLACWVLLTGAIYLTAQLLHIEVSFWNVLWPSFLFVLGIFGLYPRFSVFRLGCALVGGYFLADKLMLLELHLNKGILFAVLILLVGVSLLLDSLRKYKKSQTYSNYKDFNGKIHHGKICNDYSVGENSFSYNASFGSSNQPVQLEHLQQGQISVNFGEYTVDLTGVASVAGNCRLEADCSFGELTILIPRRYMVFPGSSTSFASFEVYGQPDPSPQGEISLNADVSFGSICIRYI